MAGNVDYGINEQLMDRYFDDQQDDQQYDLDDFIVYSDDEQQQHQRQELEEEMEDAGEEEEEVEVEEEEEEAPVGQQEILSLREQLKEEIRRKNSAVAASTGNSSVSLSKNETIMPPAKDRYGTFFGPSKPVLARRVIEEGCSSIMKELQNIPSRKDVSLVSKSQPGAVKKMQKPKFVSEEKRKIDTLRENRDYSCLFSDDADTQIPTKETQVRGPLNSAERSKLSTGQPGRSASKEHGSRGSSASVQARYKAASLRRDAHADRIRVVAAGRHGSNQLPSLTKTPGLPLSSNIQKLQPSLQSKRPQALILGQRLQQQSQSQRPHGGGRQPSLQGRKPDPSVQVQSIRQSGSTELHGKLKSASKQLVSSSKQKASRTLVKRVIKRKPNYEDDENAEAFSMLRGMTKYDPRRFAGIDEDDRNMEADFASIQKEERRSAVLARKEDEEQLRLIQEEERRERTIKRKKTAHR